MDGIRLDAMKLDSLCQSDSLLMGLKLVNLKY